MTMKFRYFDRRYFLKITISGLVAFVGISVLIHKNDHLLKKEIFIPLTFIVTLILIWLQKSNFTKVGQCDIKENSVEFITEKSRRFIEFGDILSYKIQKFKGLLFRIKTNNRQSIVFQANDTFHSPQELEIVCSKFEKEIKAFQARTGFEIKKTPSFYDNKWTFPLLVILSILIILGLGYSIISGRKIAGSFFIGISALTSLWAGYISSKS